MMEIIQAVKDENLFRLFLADRHGSLASWSNWFAALRCVYGQRIPAFKHAVVRQCTGRDPARLPQEGFNTALFLTGRRSGRSRTAAVIGGYEAILAGQ